MAELANLLGVGLPWRWDGKDLVVKPRDLWVEGAASAWAESEALRAVQRHRDELTPQEYALSLAGWRQDCAAGLYEFDAPHCQMAMGGKPGRKQLALLNLQRANPRTGVTLQAIDRLFKDAKALAEYEDLQSRADADPSPADGEGGEGNLPQTPPAA